MPLPEAAALLRIRPRPHSVSDSPSIFDAPRAPCRHTLAMRQSNSLRQQVTTRRALGGKRGHGSGGAVHGDESDVTGRVSYRVDPTYTENPPDSTTWKPA